MDAASSPARGLSEAAVGTARANCRPAIDARPRALPRRWFSFRPAAAATMAVRPRQAGLLFRFPGACYPVD